MRDGQRWSDRWTKGGLAGGQKVVWQVDKSWSGRWTKGGLAGGLAGGLDDDQKVI